MNDPYSWTPWLHNQDYPPGVFAGGGIAASLGAPVPASGDYSISGQVPPLEPSSKGPLPDYMAGVNEALAQNEAIGAEKAAKGGSPIGKFLLGWAGHLGDTLTGNPVYAKQMLLKQEMEADEEERRRRAMQPQQVGSSIIVPDGMGGYRTLFRDPSTPEAYGLALGYQPGTPEFFEAVRQYRLGSWNDDATANRMGLSGYNFDRRGQLQDDRQEYGRSMQEDRQSHSDAQLGRRLGVTRRGQDMTDSRVRGSAGYQGRGRPADRSDLLGPVYQKNGRRVQYSRKAGGYIDLETGKRVN